MKSKGSIGKSSIALTASQFTTIFISIFTSMLLSRFRSLSEYGTYSQMLIVINMTYSIFMLGIPNSINYFLGNAENDLQRKEYIKTYYLLSLLLAVLNGTVLIISLPLMVQYFNNPLIQSFYYFLAVMPFTKITLQSVEFFLIDESRTVTLVVFRIINSVLVLVIILLVEVLGLSFMTYMMFFVILELALSFTSMVLLNFFKIKEFFKINYSLMKKIIIFSFPFGLSSLVSSLIMESNKIFVGHFFTLEEYAIYSNAARELPIAVIATSLTVITMPYIVRYIKSGNTDRAVNMWKNSIVFAYLFISLISFGLFTFSKEVITILYSSKYSSGSSVFMVYSMIPLLRCTYFGMFLSATGKTKNIFYSAIIALIVSLITLFPFYYLFGIIGPAISTLVAVLTMNSYQLVFTAKIIGKKIRNIFPFSELFKITLMLTIFSIVFKVFQFLLPVNNVLSPIFEAVLLGLIWAIVYLLVYRKKIYNLWQLLKIND